jgi:hypothetical protein
VLEFNSSTRMVWRSLVGLVVVDRHVGTPGM